jgi:hypothetical protein
MKQPAFCSACGSTLSPTVHFCEQCGAPVSPAQAPIGAAQPAAPFSYISNKANKALVRPEQSRRWLLLLLPLIIVIYIMFFLAIAASDKNVTINDTANVLNVAQVRQAAQELSTNITILTISNFTDTNQAFDAQYGNRRTSNQITIAIDTHNRHITITGGKGISLSNNQYQEAVNAFSTTFQQQGYTGATIATLDTLKQDLYGSKVMQDIGYSIKTTTYSILGPIGTTILWIIMIIPLGLLTLIVGGRRSNRRRYRYSRSSGSSGGGGGASGNF